MIKITLIRAKNKVKNHCENYGKLLKSLYGELLDVHVKYPPLNHLIKTKFWIRLLWNYFPLLKPSSSKIIKTRLHHWNKILDPKKRNGTNISPEYSSRN